MLTFLVSKALVQLTNSRSQASHSHISAGFAVQNGVVLKIYDKTKWLPKVQSTLTALHKKNSSQAIKTSVISHSINEL